MPVEYNTSFSKAFKVYLIWLLGFSYLAKSFSTKEKNNYFNFSYMQLNHLAKSWFFGPIYQFGIFDLEEKDRN